MIRLIVSLLFLGLPPFSHAVEGVTVRGGGDEIAFAFNEALRSSLREIQGRLPELQARVEPLQLGAMPPSVTIYVVDQPLLVSAGQGEQESVAANDPATRTIWIHRGRWTAITSERLRQAIALHEYLSLLRIEGTGRYPISMAYLSAFEANHGKGLLLGAGGEADPLLWRRQKIRCHLREIERQFRQDDDYKETDPVRQLVRTTTHAALSWQVAGRRYDLEFYPRSKVQVFPHSHSFMLNILLQQRVRSFEKETEAGSLYLSYGRSVEWDDWGFLAGSGDDEEELRYEEVVNEQERVEWTWERGRKRVPLNRTVTRRLPDGTLHSIREDLSIRSQTVSKITECTVKNVDADEWLPPADQKLLDEIVASLNAQARLANDTEQAFRSCNPDTCPALEQKARGALARFDEAWDKVYELAEERNKKAEALRDAERKRLKDEWEKKKAQEQPR